MKGIAHFAAGVAVASCFPAAVRAGADGSPLYFLLGGAFGLLPDTLDFRAVRFLYRHDMEIAPDPLKPDPDLIAAALARAVDRAAESGRPVRVKLDTVRLGADLWQSYTVRFDVARRRVTAVYGPAVDTGQHPAPGAPVPAQGRGAAAPVGAELKLDYQAATQIDIFDGPVFLLRPETNGRVCVSFLPWHRQWSHSLAVALVPAAAAAALWDWVAGAIVFCAMSAHALLDQLGYMGSNLFFPFTTRRRRGLQWMHSGEGLPNLAAVWISCVVVTANLCRAAPGAAFSRGPLSWLFLGILLPWAALWLGRRLLNTRRRRAAG